MKFDVDIESLKPLAANFPTVTADWGRAERINAVRMRWGIGRGNSRVNPGLYKLGNPDSKSDVFLSANYRLSFDILKKNLNGMNAWILVIDTKGVNVWCAAGKGNFSTASVCKGIIASSLKEIITHRRIIVPQLAATGIAAHKVMEQTGFKVVFGPVRANDIAAFVIAGYKATREMRTVTFPWYERAKLIPVDLMYAKYKLILFLLLFFFLSGLDRNGFLFKKMFTDSLFPLTNIVTGYLAGIVITPLLLPMTPFRPFAAKGAFWGVLFALLNGYLFSESLLMAISMGLISTAISSFMAMNFTGSSTFTSISGVKLEMKWAIPIQLVLASLGFILFIVLKLI